MATPDSSNGCVRTLLTLVVLLSFLAHGRGFFLPSFSKKPDTSSWGSNVFGTRDNPQYYGQQQYSFDSTAQAAYPVAMPYPVAIPAHTHSQISASPPVLPQIPMTSASFQGTYHNMQLVPCLCSVPKEDQEDPSSLVVQGTPKFTNK